MTDGGLENEQTMPVSRRERTLSRLKQRLLVLFRRKKHLRRMEKGLYPPLCFVMFYSFTRTSVSLGNSIALATVPFGNKSDSSKGSERLFAPLGTLNYLLTGIKNASRRSERYACIFPAVLLIKRRRVPCRTFLNKKTCGLKSQRWHFVLALKCSIYFLLSLWGNRAFMHQFKFY